MNMHTHSRLLAPLLAQVLVLAMWTASGAVASPALDGSETADRSGPRPRLELPQPEYQAGKRAPGPSLEVSFPVRNSGDGPLEITEARADCGCMVAAFDREIGPGQTGTVRATLRTEGLRGRLAKSIRIETNDPDHPTAVLSLHVTLVPAISFDPAEDVAVPYQPGRIAVREVTITCLDPQPLVIEKVASSAAFLRARVVSEAATVPTAAAKGESAVRVALVVDADAPDGDFAETVTLTTNQERHRQITLTVHGYPRGAVMVSPPSLRLEGLRTQSLSDVAGVATFHRSTPFRILRADSDDPALHLELSADDSGQFWKLRVTYSGGWPAGDRSGTLRIATDDPRRPVVELPYRADVRP